jgi:hypothetical protein
MDAHLLKIALLDPSMWRQIDGYLDQLLDLEPGQRGQWLADLATTQPLIASLLRKLLTTPDTGIGRFLEGTPVAEIELATLHASVAGKQTGPTRSRG